MRVAAWMLASSITALLAGGGAMHRADEALQRPTRVDFASEVLPVLASHCFRCHGGVREMAGLNLSDPARVKSVLRSGHAAVVEGDPARSELLARVSTDNADLRMPPEGAGLSVREVSLIERWIAEGAAWGSHWSFAPREEPAVPEIARDGWSQRPLDRFVLEGLARASLDPAPRADPETLVRRVALDLTGLPPRDEVRAAYLADPSPAGYARLVDALLADAAYGERFARLWLDLGRYADTQGYEKDSRRDIWAWRDWVVDALNADMPYDRFAVRMLAGDMLPEATEADRVATGFHRNTLTNTEGGTDNEEFRMAAVFDRVSTTWQSFLGVTFQCVQCHGHPYEPISQREYYGFLAYLNQTADEDRDDDQPRLEVERAGVKTSVPVLAEVAAERRRTTRLLVRGALSAPADAVEPHLPAALGAVSEVPRDRLGMAEWVADSGNPLFARVAANRAWETLFGRGIVETSEDFGVMGSGASDRRLLDHLAGVLVAKGFSMKELLREIVTSATYMQSSVASDAARVRDPDNRLWSRAPRLRLEAEQVRDQALAVSGLLSRKLGGPPVMPPQPEGVWQVVYSGDAWRTSEGEDRYRRAIYTFLRRSSPYPSFIAFDATSRETCTVRRTRTNTPLAALVTLNDPVYLECAQALAVAVRDERDDARAVRDMFARALGRAARDDEAAVLLDLVWGERARYAGCDELARVFAGRAADGS
ncbi:MAG: PSD1 and planctomycete cytochrome C domain-containing protein, partial [Planctomycetaceae bacterium]|nr:PSD1 and planctomycete cytochrome C domain-containing protein [Planctomycetaceae bacterium]